MTRLFAGARRPCWTRAGTRPGVGVTLSPASRTVLDAHSRKVCALAAGGQGEPAGPGAGKTARLAVRADCAGLTRAAEVSAGPP